MLSPSRILRIVVVSFGCVTARMEAADHPALPLPSAHAHNDYQHPRPLLDALDHGFCSVEADVFLVGGQLLVGHSRFELAAERTLERLYLDPLRQRTERYGGRVYPAGPTFTLLVDFKSDGLATYRALQAALVPYQAMLCRVRNGEPISAAVQIVISGDRPIAQIAETAARDVFVDGRLADLDRAVPTDLMPLISDRWGAHFGWRGEGPFADAEQRRLDEIVRRAHQRGQRVRFWATPDRVEVWQVLRDAGVDLINTDDLEGLQTFLRRASGEEDHEPDAHSADFSIERKALIARLR